jgi:ribosomal-protein-alanine N-acetyltransferase
MTQNDGEARVSLRPLGSDDQDEFIAQARASAGLHHPWFTMPTTPGDFQTYLAKFSRPTTEGFLVCLREGGALAGMIRATPPPCCSSTAPGGTTSDGPSPGR